MLRLEKYDQSFVGTVNIPTSKSISNRLLILQAVFPNLKIKNLSTSDDTRLLKQALKSAESEINVGHAGTAMRFLTAFFATQKNKEIVLTGSQRMQQRPIKHLVEALKMLGADIDYLENEGFPPLRIRGRKLKGGKVTLPANISSQYITALMLVAPKLPQGLEIHLEGSITSESYINMTLEILKKLGIDAFSENKKIKISPKSSIVAKTFMVEPDWSSASYFYSLVALSESAKIQLSDFQKESLQGDAIVAEIYKSFGVRSTFSKDFVLLEKFPKKLPKKISLNLKNSPDLAQTIAVTCLGLGIECELTGLQTLKIKETDRLQALKTEMEKFGADVSITAESLHFLKTKRWDDEVVVETYQDHRMALSFAPLALVRPIVIADEAVVSKSYPQFWEDLKLLGFQLQKC